MTTTTTTTTTTPDEFLQFAKDLGLEEMKTINNPPPNNNNGYTQTGLSVLNNLCHLIEQIHRLRMENDHLRAHLDLTKHVEKLLSKTTEKPFMISPSNSIKGKKYGSSTLSTSSRERQGTDYGNHLEDYSSTMHLESDLMGSNLGLASPTPSWNHWNKVRHALKFSLRRKAADIPVINPISMIPSISISVESADDEQVVTTRESKKKKKSLSNNDHRRDVVEEETDHEDDSIDSHRIDHKRESYRNNRMNSSSNETSTPIPTDDDPALARKQSKIAHYRRKLRSKLNTVKRQFSDQTSSSTCRLISSTHGSIFDEFTGVNQALLTAQLAPALTKSYQQKMRQWQTIQKSHFLVNYRRQSIIPRTESNSDSRKTSIIVNDNDLPLEIEIPSPDQPISNDQENTLLQSPTLSPHQRSLIVHQWRSIMAEEISLRIYSEYLEKKFAELKQLQTDLKSLKTRIFSTNNQDYLLKHRSMTSMEQLDQDVLDQYQQRSFPQRCQSCQSLISMPASWILAVQSATYSDILDGTSKKTSDRAIIFNKHFFQQLNHFKSNRMHFEENFLKQCPLSNKSISTSLYERNSSTKQSMRSRSRTVLNRAYLRKVSTACPIEIPALIPMVPIQSTTSTMESSSHIDLLDPCEIESTLPSSSSSTLNKRSKRYRFDLRKTLRRSKSMCFSQFQSWFRRRPQQSSIQQTNLVKPRRKSAIETKSRKEVLTASSSKLYASPHLARLHRRMFKQQPWSAASAPASPTSELLPPLPLSHLDDSDENFPPKEIPVRIYLPAQTSPSTRHVRIVDNAIKPPSLSKITSPIINRRNPPSSMKTPTARERRESFASASSSNVLNN